MATQKRLSPDPKVGLGARPGNQGITGCLSIGVFQPLLSSGQEPELTAVFTLRNIKRS